MCELSQNRQQDSRSSPERARLFPVKDSEEDSAGLTKTPVLFNVPQKYLVSADSQALLTWRRRRCCGLR